MSNLFEELDAKIENFDFIAALRAIESQRQDLPRLGTAHRASEETVRLSQKPATAFQGASLSSFENHSGKHKHRLYCNFFGLFGTNGPMPLHYTEYADQRARHHHDPTFQEFFDIFNHRMLSLFYRATAEFDPAINQDRPGRNNINDIISAIGGYLPNAAKDRDSIPDYTKYFFVGWMGAAAKSPDGMISMVSEYFGVSTAVEEFTGDWLPLPANTQIALSGSTGNAELGVSTYIGRKVWSVGHKFTLVLGPLNWREYLSFKPGGRRVRELYDLMTNYIGEEWDWDLKLIIKDDDVKGFTLNNSAALGFNSFLCGSRATLRPAQEVRLHKSVLTAQVQ